MIYSSFSYKHDRVPLELPSVVVVIIAEFSGKKIYFKLTISNFWLFNMRHYLSLFFCKKDPCLGHPKAA